MDRGQLDEWFTGAVLFVNTSPAEGHSNTLLEAWARGLPTIAAVDPDGVIAREGLGEVATDFEALERAVRSWMADPERRRAAGGRARAAVLARHGPEAVLDRFATLLDSMVARVRERRA